MFNNDTKVVIHPDAGSSDPVHDPYSLRLDLHYGEVICWQLSYLLDDGRLRVLNGPGRHPSVIAVPEPNVDLSSCVLVEDGEVISRRRYRVAPGETER
jgi:hypothetical protein